ncbi:MAG TPA: hypothetical protein QGF58_19075 [Myxococcota bacterium]|nr:hypothetical protein [Myxococcota bacterium]
MEPLQTVAQRDLLPALDASIPAEMHHRQRDCVGSPVLRLPSDEHHLVEPVTVDIAGDDLGRVGRQIERDRNQGQMPPP